MSLLPLSRWAKVGTIITTSSRELNTCACIICLESKIQFEYSRWDYKAAELGNYKLNVTTFWLDMFAKIGWAYDLKQPSAELVRKTIEKHGNYNSRSMTSLIYILHLDLQVTELIQSTDTDTTEVNTATWSPSLHQANQISDTNYRRSNHVKSINLIIF